MKEEFLRIIDFKEAKGTNPSGIIAFIGNPYDVGNMTIVLGDVIPGGVSGAVYTPSSEIFESAQQTWGCNKAVIYADIIGKE